MPNLPLTPLHYPVAYFIYRIDKRFSLPGLIVGCMFPDLEIPLIGLILGTQVPNRMVLHSILGASTVGTFLAVIATVRVYPYFVTHLFHVNKLQVESKTKLSFWMVFSVFIGIISHVLLDFTNHPYNPIFWPFRSAIATQSQIYFALGTPIGSLYMQFIMGVFFASLIVIKRKNVFDELLVG